MLIFEIFSLKKQTNNVKRNIIHFCLPGFANSLLKYKNFLRLGSKNSIFLKYKMFLQSRFLFYSSSLESSLLKFFNFRLESSIFENIRNFLIWELESSISWNMTKFLILELEIFISWNITNFFGADFFFSSLGLKVHNWRSLFLLLSFSVHKVP